LYKAGRHDESLAILNVAMKEMNSRSTSIDSSVDLEYEKRVHVGVLNARAYALYSLKEYDAAVSDSLKCLQLAGEDNIDLHGLKPLYILAQSKLEQDELAESVSYCNFAEVCIQRQPSSILGTTDKLHCLLLAFRGIKNIGLCRVQAAIYKPQKIEAAAEGVNPASASASASASAPDDCSIVTVTTVETSDESRSAKARRNRQKKTQKKSKRAEKTELNQQQQGGDEDKEGVDACLLKIAGEAFELALDDCGASAQTSCLTPTSPTYAGSRRSSAMSSLSSVSTYDPANEEQHMPLSDSFSLSAQYLKQQHLQQQLEQNSTFNHQDYEEYREDGEPTDGSAALLNYEEQQQYLQYQQCQQQPDFFHNACLPQEGFQQYQDECQQQYFLHQQHQYLLLQQQQYMYQQQCEYQYHLYQMQEQQCQYQNSVQEGCEHDVYREQEQQDLRSS
jgi:hypothetical protein